jgi:UDP-N-acetylmuramyl pentapeptide phosphotransferase/UDP-N-acetylglucosamine-1-phosphate transferase
MAYLAKLDLAKEDETLAQERLGSVLITVGGVLFVFGIILGIYNFTDFREGTHLMLSLTAGLTLIGLCLMAVGKWKKKTHPV